MSSIQLLGVRKQWGPTTALADINLTIEPGSFCVLLGPSGCGKSTTLRIIAGLESASAGRVLIDGRDVTALPPAQRGIAMVFQNYALFPHLSVADNIRFGLSVRKLPPGEISRRLHETAELLGLTALLARKPSQLSGGQQQRVALGRALVAQAKVCLMDEPLSNLDAQLRQDMRRELRELQKRLGLTVVYVTHDQTEAMSMADQVLLLHQGQIEQAATPRLLYAQPASTFAARFIGTPPMNLLRLRAGRIAGSDLPVLGLTADLDQAAFLGLRPEAVRLLPPDAPQADAGMATHRIAQVRGSEYLGADLVLHCAIGEETLTVRLDGRAAQGNATPLDVGATVRLDWDAADAHLFDADGRRITPASSLH
ncbi:ABC transporter ATP-binding protein [Hylemonella gracilis]|uniref:ABC transporter ATP-binding protein n=1 Tax=Hylemonella gracilis TaxID=80880 RepID=A0A4P6UQ38_9BURK|nr:ABC transporter ATP-binding protein [Hylemonella gracilis]QBK05821.1 ABC transporter ATP-binding protein [Hylemonella gracilis]